VLGDTLAALVHRYGASANRLQLETLRRVIAHHRADTQRRLREKPKEIAHSQRHFVGERTPTGSVNTHHPH
jgi:hypothetical protein